MTLTASVAASYMLVVACCTGFVMPPALHMRRTRQNMAAVNMFIRKLTPSICHQRAAVEH
jgi:hypothetical protein